MLVAIGTVVLNSRQVPNDHSRNFGSAAAVVINDSVK